MFKVIADVAVPLLVADDCHLSVAVEGDRGLLKLYDEPASIQIGVGAVAKAAVL